MRVLVVIDEEKDLRRLKTQGLRLEAALERTMDWIYRERDIRFTEKDPNFRFPLMTPGTYELSLHDFGGLVTHDEAAKKFRELGLKRARSLHLYLEALRQHPDLLLEHPVVSNVSWTSPDGDHGVIYADLGLGDRPLVHIHYPLSGFSSRCRFLG